MVKDYSYFFFCILTWTTALSFAITLFSKSFITTSSEDMLGDPMPLTFTSEFEAKTPFYHEPPFPPRCCKEDLPISKTL